MSARVRRGSESPVSESQCIDMNGIPCFFNFQAEGVSVFSSECLRPLDCGLVRIQILDGKSWDMSYVSMLRNDLCSTYATKRPFSVPCITGFWHFYLSIFLLYIQEGTVFLSFDPLWDFAVFPVFSLHVSHSKP